MGRNNGTPFHYSTPLMVDNEPAPPDHIPYEVAIQGQEAASQWRYHYKEYLSLRYQAKKLLQEVQRPATIAADRNVLIDPAHDDTLSDLALESLERKARKNAQNTRKLRSMYTAILSHKQAYQALENPSST